MSDDVTTHQIQGVCGGVMMKGEWQEYHVDIGKQYPVKLSTKHDDIKALAAAAGTEMAVWTYTEKQGGPNPHRPGEFFKNRYLSNVEVGGTLDPALAGQQTISDAPAGGGVSRGGMPSPEGREISIERQVLVKSAIGLLADKPIPVDEWFALMDRLDDWMARDRTKKEATEKDGKEESAATSAPAGSAPDDDDIPF